MCVCDVKLAANFPIQYGFKTYVAPVHKVMLTCARWASDSSSCLLTLANHRNSCVTIIANFYQL